MEYNNDYYQQVLSMIYRRILVKFGYQKRFAEEIGIDPGNLSKFLKGKYYPSSRVFVEICLVLGIGIFYPIDTKQGYLYPTCVFDSNEKLEKFYEKEINKY